jgi:hypothetical protein
MSIGSDEQGPVEDGLGEFMNGGYLAVVIDVLAKENEKREAAGQEGSWEIYDAAMEPDFLLSCPCGSVIELDGRCSRGHLSPVRGAGLI